MVVLTTVVGLTAGSLPLSLWLGRLALGVSGWALLPVALAPIGGHDFSPLLRFRGGKGVAATFGAWLAFAGPLAVLTLAVCFAVFFALRVPDAWTDLAGPTLFSLVLALTGAATALIATAVACLGLLTGTNRAKLHEAPCPQLRSR